MTKRANGQPEGEASNRGADFDPNATSDALEEEAPPQAVSRGSPVSDDELKKMKEEAENAERNKVERTIGPQTDDSARFDESGTKPEHD